MNKPSEMFSVRTRRLLEPLLITFIAGGIAILIDTYADGLEAEGVIERSPTR